LISVFFNSKNLVSVKTGTLTIQGDGVDSGTIAIAANTSMIFSAGHDTFADGTLVTGNGTLVINNGEELTIQGFVTFDCSNVIITDSTLTGPGAVTVNKALSWSSSVMSGTGITILAPTSTTNITGSDTIDTR